MMPFLCVLSVQLCKTFLSIDLKLALQSAYGFWANSEHSGTEEQHTTTTGSDRIYLDIFFLLKQISSYLTICSILQYEHLRQAEAFAPSSRR